MPTPVAEELYVRGAGAAQLKETRLLKSKSLYMLRAQLENLWSEWDTQH